MHRRISFGKFDFYKRGRKINEITVDVYLENRDGKTVFSSCCSVWNATHTDIVCGGQSFDAVLKVIPSLKDNELFATIYDLWKNYHSNDLNASANDEQRNAEKEFCKKEPYDYDKVCSYLAEKNLLDVIVDGKVCRYGAQWYYREIPEEDLIKIREIINQ